MEVSRNVHEPKDAAPLSSKAIPGFKAASFTGRDKHADAIGVCRKARLGFRRTMQGALASLAGGMLR